MFRKPLRCIPIRLSEAIVGQNGEIKKVIQLLRVGEFTAGKDESGAPIKVKVTKEYLDSMVKNFSEKVRGIDLMLDYSHLSQNEAAAWIDKVYTLAEGMELWAEVSWTPKGEDKVKNKEYRYISADFHVNYEDNETGKKFGPTLMGAGLTNRPVVKGMEPVMLSETNDCNSNKDKSMDYEKELAEEKKKTAKLADDFAAFKKKKDDEEEAKVLADKKAEEDKKLGEKKEKFDKMLSESKVVEAQRKPFMENDTVKFAELHAEIKLEEKGDTTAGKDKSEVKGTAQDKIVLMATKLCETDKTLTFSEASRRIRRDNKELNDGYLKETEG